MRLCSAKQKSSRQPSSAALRPCRCGAIVPGLTTLIEAAIGAGSHTRGEHSWQPSGHYTKQGDDFIGSVKTLTLNVKARFSPAEAETDKAPAYRITAGATEFGAAWKKTAKETGREYLSVKLDDPSFPAPIYASLIQIEGEESLSLIWSRRSGE